MKIKLIDSNEIITSNWDFLHNKKSFEKYLFLFKSKKISSIPPVPLIKIEIVEKHLSKELREKLKNFKKTHKKAKYFLLDGSHRTTAATLTKNKISSILINNERDIEKALKMKNEGKIDTWRLGTKMEKIIKDLVRHFEEKPRFQTVDEKSRVITLSFQ